MPLHKMRPSCGKVRRDRKLRKENNRQRCRQIERHKCSHNYAYYFHLLKSRLSIVRKRSLNWQSLSEYCLCWFWNLIWSRNNFSTDSFPGQRVYSRLCTKMHDWTRKQIWCIYFSWRTTCMCMEGDRCAPKLRQNANSSNQQISKFALSA